MKQLIKAVRVNLNGEILYMTVEAYKEFTLTLSTGDFHTHKKQYLKKLPKSVPSWRVRNAEYYNPRIQYPTVESIIAGYKNEDASAEEYAVSEDSPLAEFVSSFCYHELTLDQMLEHCRLEDATIELIKSYHSKLGLKALHTILEENSELQLVDIWYQDGEICSATIGEQEHQVDDTLAEAYQTLSPEDKERVERESGAGIPSRGDGRWIYTSHDYERWIMLADEQKLCRKLKRAMKAV